MLKQDRWFSNPTQVFWTCRALLEGAAISTETEINAVKGWRLAAITENLRKRYGWPIEAEYRGPERVAFYRLTLGTDRAKLRFPPSAKSLAVEVGE